MIAKAEVLRTNLKASTWHELETNDKRQRDQGVYNCKVYKYSKGKLKMERQLRGQGLSCLFKCLEFRKTKVITLTNNP